MGPVEKRLRDQISKYGTICLGLVDTENTNVEDAIKISSLCEQAGCSGVLIGGSTAVDQIYLDLIIKKIKKKVKIPIILFPSNISGIAPNADAILFSSLINSDNPYFIVQAQALGALLVKKYDLEALPLAYIIVGEGGTAGFIGRARGIPPDKPDIANMYALAAQYMGMRFIYLEAGSGMISHLPLEMISHVKRNTNTILIVGGGIKNPLDATKIAQAGADIIIIGTLLEKKGFENAFKKLVRSIKNTKKSNP